MAYYQLIREQRLKTSVDEIWEFISSPNNLKKITPSYLGFNITTENLPAQMYPGMIIGYTVSPILGIKTTWVTEITHVNEGVFFVDEQRVGPYKMWHHEHHLEPLGNGVKMTDIITYQPPLGFLGALANSLLIRNQLKEIFDYRYRVIDELFGKVLVE